MCTTLPSTPHALVTFSCRSFPQFLTLSLCSESHAKKIDSTILTVDDFMSTLMIGLLLCHVSTEVKSGCIVGHSLFICAVPRCYSISQASFNALLMYNTLIRGVQIQCLYSRQENREHHDGETNGSHKHVNITDYSLICVQCASSPCYYYR